MALQLSFNSSQGFTASSAYFKVTRVQFQNDNVSIYGSWFYNKSARDANAVTMDNYFYETTCDNLISSGAGEDIPTLAYMFVKSLPEFTDAIDV